MVETSMEERTQLATALPEPETWRDLLAILISDPKARARAAQAMDIGEITLKRWATNTTNPRPSALRPLLVTFPEYRDLWIRLIPKEFKNFSPNDHPDFEMEPMREETEHLPLSLYEEALALRAKSHPSLLSWSVCSLVLREFLEQLDPRQAGLGIWVAKCLVSSERKAKPFVHSLRECFQVGNPPWRTDREVALLLGAESLAAHSILSAQPQVCQNIAENPTFLPIRPEQFEASCAAFPIQQGERFAGVLLISSTQTNFFDEGRLTLIQHYANLMCLAFRDEEFWPKDTFLFRTLPETAIQKAHFTEFRPRVTALIESSHLSVVEAEELVWAQIAEKLFSKG